jgi:hypothetical protein
MWLSLHVATIKAGAAQARRNGEAAVSEVLAIKEGMVITCKNL